MFVFFFNNKKKIIIIIIISKAPFNPILNKQVNSESAFEASCEFLFGKLLLNWKWSCIIRRCVPVFLIFVYFTLLRRTDDTCSFLWTVLQCFGQRNYGWGPRLPARRSSAWWRWGWGWWRSDDWWADGMPHGSCVTDRGEKDNSVWEWTIWQFLKRLVKKKRSYMY